MALTKISTAMISQDASSVDLNIDAGTLYIDSTNNRVGVSNTSPSTPLHVTGTATVTTLTDGTLSISSGSITSAIAGTFSGTLTGGTFTDGTLSISSGAITSATSGTFSGAVTGGTLTDGTLSISSGSITSGVAATFSGALTGGTLSIGNITTTGYLRGPSTFTIDPATHGDDTGTVVIAGNLQVDGTTTTINSTTLEVDDKNITLASGSANAAAADGAGFTVDIGSGTLPSITYDGTNDEWDFNKNVNVDGTVKIGDTLILREDGTNDLVQSTGNVLYLKAPEFNFQDNSGNQQFYTTSSRNFIVQNSLGIGTNSPANSLEIQHSTVGTGNGSNNTLALRYNSTTLYGQHYMDANGIYNILADSSGAAGGNMQLNADTTIRIATGSTPTERMRIDSSGNVGIGNDNPGHLLDLRTASGDATINIKTTTGGDPTIIFNSAAANRSGLIKYQDNGTNIGRIEYVHNGDRIDIQAGSATGATMSIENGAVGIGTTSPNSPLHIQADGIALRLDGTANTTRTIFFRSTTDANPATIYSDGSFKLYTEDPNTDIRFSAIRDIEYQSTSTNSTAGHHIFKSYNTEIMRIDGANNRVGIGTDSPQEFLHIFNSSASWDQYANIRMSTENDSYAAEIGFHRGTSNDSDRGLFLSGDGTNKHVRVLHGGNVGIGTTSPGAPLHVLKDLDSGGTILQLTNADSTYNQHLTVKFNSDKDIEFEGASGNGGIIMDPGSRGTRFQISSADIGRFDADGLRLESGKGIKFSPHASGNILDDYEEGTWTPVYSGSTTTGTGTYTRQSGVYVKVGNLVYASCTIGISAHTGSGNAEVTGLPFTALNNTGNYAGILVSFNNGHTTTSGYQIIGFVQVGTAGIRLWETGGTGQQNALALDTSFAEFDFSIVYRAA